MTPARWTSPSKRDSRWCERKAAVQTAAFLHAGSGEPCHPQDFASTRHMAYARALIAGVAADPGVSGAWPTACPAAPPALTNGLPKAQYSTTIPATSTAMFSTIRRCRAHPPGMQGRAQDGPNPAGSARFSTRTSRSGTSSGWEMGSGCDGVSALIVGKTKARRGNHNDDGTPPDWLSERLHAVAPGPVTLQWTRLREAA